MKKIEFLSDKTRIFIDTNIFVYAMIGKGGIKNKCQTFLNLVNRGKYQGVINTTVISEVFHTIMLNEIERRGIKEPVPYLKKNPDTIKNTSKPFAGIEKILGMSNLSITSETPESIKSTIRICKNQGLLFNDAKMVSSCQEKRINDIATNDNDFENIGLIVWTP